MAKKAAKQPAAGAADPPKRRIADWLERRSAALFLALVALGTLRIVATYTVFNHTIDEPAHIACGIEWLQKHRYQYEPQHPPLARVAAAVLPYLAGRRMVDKAIGQNGQIVYPPMYDQGGGYSLRRWPL